MQFVFTGIPSFRKFPASTTDPEMREDFTFLVPALRRGRSPTRWHGASWTALDGSKLHACLLLVGQNPSDPTKIIETSTFRDMAYVTPCRSSSRRKK